MQELSPGLLGGSQAVFDRRYTEAGFPGRTADCPHRDKAPWSVQLTVSPNPKVNPQDWVTRFTAS
jgi:hypothetical protein